MGFFDRIAGTLDELARDAALPEGAREELDLARALADRGDLDEAEIRLLGVTERFPRLAAGFVALGEVRVSRGDREGAAISFGRAVDLDADDAESWLRLGEALADLRRFEPARDALRRALTLAIDAAARGRAHTALGRLYLDAGQTGKAVRELRKAVDIQPDDLSIAATFGRALVSAGEPDAADWLTRAARAPGADPALFVEAAEARADDAAAERLLREALEATGAVVVRAALARHLTRTGRADEGLALALACIAAAPNDPAGLAALRESYAATGRWTDALAAARRERELGAALPFRRFLELALGARDRSAVADALTRVAAANDGAAAPEDDAALAGAARAFVESRAAEPELLMLAAVAPDEPARRFVVESLAPPPVPAGNVVGLLGYAHELATRNPELYPLATQTARAVEAFDRPLLVAVMGEFNAGKSSFVNALCGQEVAPVGVTPTTATINILRHGPHGGRISYHDGTVRELAGEDVTPFLRGVTDRDAGLIRLVEIFFPLETLRLVEIVDTPGLNSLRAEHERVAREFLVEADAIVWLFAVGQAAKGTEKQALSLAHAAHKRVLGVLNKADRASADELEAVSQHVAESMGDLVEAVVPLSARGALGARRAGDASALATSGLPAVEEALETRFFARARDLKRATALGALARFLAEARPAAIAPPRPDYAAQRAALARGEQEVKGTLAAERVALRARIDEAYRSAAFEVREFVRPRSWLFGEHRAEEADEEFLLDLLDDAIVRATDTTRAALKSAATGAPQEPAAAPPAPLFAPVFRVIDACVDRFRAYARGVLEGGTVADFFRHDLPRIRLDLTAIRNALIRRAPDPEPALFRPAAAELARIYQHARREVDRAATGAEVSALIRRARLEDPLAALERTARELGSTVA